MRRIVTRRFKWPRGIKRGLPAARFLGLRVRIPQGYGCLSLVRVVCCEKRYNNYLHLQPVGRKSSEQEKKERNKENYSGSFNKTEQLSIQTINKFSPHATLLETK